MADDFQIGDRVRVGAGSIFPAGRLGIVVQSCGGAGTFVEVQFDDATDPHVMLHRELERASDLDEAGQAGG